MSALFKPERCGCENEKDDDYTVHYTSTTYIKSEDSESGIAEQKTILCVRYFIPGRSGEQRIDIWKDTPYFSTIWHNYYFKIDSDDPDRVHELFTFDKHKEYGYLAYNLRREDFPKDCVISEKTEVRLLDDTSESFKFYYRNLLRKQERYKEKLKKYQDKLNRALLLEKAAMALM